MKKFFDRSLKAAEQFQRGAKLLEVYEKNPL